MNLFTYLSTSIKHEKLITFFSMQLIPQLSELLFTFTIESMPEISSLPSYKETTITLMESFDDRLHLLDFKTHQISTAFTSYLLETTFENRIQSNFLSKTRDLLLNKSGILRKISPLNESDLQSIKQFYSIPYTKSTQTYFYNAFDGTITEFMYSFTLLLSNLNESTLNSPHL